jgi:hypothetical protein
MLYIVKYRDPYSGKAKINKGFKPATKAEALAEAYRLEDVGCASAWIAEYKERNKKAANQ